MGSHSHPRASTSYPMVWENNKTEKKALEQINSGPYNCNDYFDPTARDHSHSQVSFLSIEMPQYFKQKGYNCPLLNHPVALGEKALNLDSCDNCQQWQASEELPSKLLPIIALSQHGKVKLKWGNLSHIGRYQNNSIYFKPYRHTWRTSSE